MHPHCSMVVGGNLNAGEVQRVFIGHGAIAVDRCRLGLGANSALPRSGVRPPPKLPCVPLHPSGQFLRLKEHF